MFHAWGNAGATFVSLMMYSGLSHKPAQLDSHQGQLNAHYQDHLCSHNLSNVS